MTRIVSQLLALSAMILAISLIRQKVVLDRSDPYRCNALRDRGRWLDQAKAQNGPIQPHHWQPPGCILHEFNAHEIEQCLDCSRLLFAGDSNVRQLFWATAMKANKTLAEHAKLYAEKHGNFTFNVGCSKLEFLWDPYLNSSLLLEEIFASGGLRDTGGLLPLRRQGHQTAIVAGGGLWHARYLDNGYRKAFKNSIETLSSVSQNRDTTELTTLVGRQRSLLLLMPILSPNYDMLDEGRNATLTPERLSTLNDYLLEPSTSSGMQILRSFPAMLQPQILAYEDTGMHLRKEIVKRQADVVLNLRCNGVPQLQSYPFDKTCCAPTVPYNTIQVIMLILTLFILILTFTTTASTALGLESPGLQQQPRINALNVMSLACAYCFLADRTHLFEKMQKTTDQRAFLWMFGFVMALGALTTARSTTANRISEKIFSTYTNYASYLSREQTEEWKGWMQFVILLYHYFGMSNVLWVYQLIRLLVASYLFLTGFGHAVFFLRHNDFSLRRLATVIVRLNMLSVLLSYTMRTQWDFYYFPALSSFWFLVTCLTMRLWRWRRAGGTPIALSACVVRLATSYPGLLEKVVKILHFTCRMNIDVHELRFRISLDMYIVYVGMLLAIGHVEFARLISPFPSSLTKQTWRRPRLSSVIAVLAAVTIIGLYISLAAQFSDKYAYNKWHALLSPFPVLAFVVLRNAAPLFREYHSWLFAWLGRCSLETFILQYHIWLAADTKGLLRLGLGFDDPGCAFCENTETVIITVFFLWTSWGVSWATTVLTEWFVGPAQMHGAHGGGKSEPVTIVQRIAARLGLRFRLMSTLVILVVCNWLWK